MLFTSDELTAPDAFRLGMVNQVVPREELRGTDPGPGRKIAEAALRLEADERGREQGPGRPGPSLRPADLLCAPSAVPQPQHAGPRAPDGPELLLRAVTRSGPGQSSMVAYPVRKSTAMSGGRGGGPGHVGQQDRDHLLGGIVAPDGPEPAVPAVLAGTGCGRVLAAGHDPDAKPPAASCEDARGEPGHRFLFRSADRWSWPRPKDATGSGLRGRSEHVAEGEVIVDGQTSPAPPDANAGGGSIDRPGLSSTRSLRWRGWFSSTYRARPRSGRHGETGVVSPERLEDPLPQERIEGTTGRPGDEHAEHVSSDVVQPPLPGLVLSGSSPRRRSHSSGTGGTPGSAARCRGCWSMAARHRRGGERYAQPETEGEQVPHRDRPLRGYGVVEPPRGASRTGGRPIRAGPSTGSSNRSICIPPPGSSWPPPSSAWSSRRSGRSCRAACSAAVPGLVKQPADPPTTPSPRRPTSQARPPTAPEATCPAMIVVKAEETVLGQS